MKKIGKINDREVWYLKAVHNNDIDDVSPQGNWLVFMIVDDNSELLSPVVQKCIQSNVAYVCCAGKEARLAEDLFDQIIVMNEIDKERITSIESDYEETPMTTAHDSIEEGFWFATCVANHKVSDVYIDINNVVCIDMVENDLESLLSDLIVKINKGWLPSD